MIFNSIPATRVPDQYVEFANSNLKGATSALNYRALILGQGTDAGTATAKTLYSISSPEEAAILFGPGSQIHLQAKSFFKNNSVNQVSAIALTMDALATATSKATGSIQITHAATAAGAIYLYIGGQRIVASVAKNDTVGAIATAIKLAMDLLPDLPVSYILASDTITFTAKNLGTCGNDIDIRLNYHVGETLPGGVTDTIVAMSGGAADPAVTTGTPSTLEVLGDTWFQILMSPYTDSTNVAALDVELERRFGPTTRIDGVCFTAKKATYANLIIFGAATNSRQLCFIGTYDYLQTPMEISAATAGQVAGSLAAGNGAESLPFQTLPLVGILAPKETSRLTFAQSDALLKGGISTLTADDGGTVRIQRLITNYQKNAANAADTTWLDVNTRFVAMFIRWDWVNYLKSKYPRAKEADDSTRMGSGQVVITPRIAKAEAIARFSTWEVLGLVQNFALFKTNLIAERDPSDPNAMNWFLPTDFVRQFIVGKTQIGVVA